MVPITTKYKPDLYPDDYRAQCAYWETTSAFRRLASSRPAQVRPGRDARNTIEAFDRIVWAGLATREEFGEPGFKDHRFEYQITDEGRTRVSAEGAWCKSAQALVPYLPRTHKAWRTTQSRVRPAGAYPAAKEVAAQLALAIRRNLDSVTTNEDHEFSSRGLTDWYVADFCRRNHLKL